MSVKKIGFALGGPVASGKTFTAKSIAILLYCNTDTGILTKYSNIYTNCSFAIIDNLKCMKEYNELKNDEFCDWYFIYLSVPQLTRLTRIKQLYPDNWKDYFNEPDLGKEAIHPSKYDCIAMSIDHVLKFIYGKI